MSSTLSSAGVMSYSTSANVPVQMCLVSEGSEAEIWINYDNGHCLGVSFAQESCFVTST